ncbi:hypothetical protein KIH27_02690 [Mycobacterium sp. M1]|uniref:Uncharacterized protein n=1 Tax=Mycolicibacter acidiphilus TaxID=2835306 RepID=A0ABS5RG94_9MYCO|nr:hypothetical protein [Mycolicibacter acidiphilus]MBS9532491.1 hypothetical protein [Mycolicibacter acidiphilus]
MNWPPHHSDATPRTRVPAYPRNRVWAASAVLTELDVLSAAIGRRTMLQ